MFDAIVVGGSFAGISAAMQLARARRQVLVIDAGRPRNRFAAAAHGFYGHDGRPPLAIRDAARQQLLAYPNVTFAAGEATAVLRADGGFVVAITAEGGGTRQERGRRLVLATGVRDELPPIAGLAERWGSTVLHCPYCHGYEIGGGPIGILGGHAHTLQKGAMFADWGPTTIFLEGGDEPDAAQAALLAARGVTIERSRVAALLGTAPALDGVCLADGRIVRIDALFVAPRTLPASGLAAQLGCAFDDGPQGPYLRVDEARQTTVPGVFAAGDAASPMHNGTLAAAAGVLAGFHAHQSLVFGLPPAPSATTG